MPLVKMAIIMACAGTDGNVNRACNSTTEAITKKVGFYDTAVQAEKNASKIAVRVSRNTLGDEPLYVVAGSYFVYKTIENKHVSFSIPTFGLCDSASNTIGLTGYQIRLGWTLP